MKRQVGRWLPLVMAIGLSLAQASAAVEAVVLAQVPMDMVVVLDNSGSMKRNDPYFLAKQGLRALLQKVPSNTQVAILTFDKEVRLVLPLTPLSDQMWASVKGDLGGLNYRGLFTDIPTALERALYELKLNGRAGAKKYILLLTDGIIDTGNKLKDLEGARWLREELATDLTRNGIGVFAIALGNKADFQLLHSLVQRTGGEYYRTIQPKDLLSVFTSIGQSLAAQTIVPERAQAGLQVESSPASDVTEVTTTVGSVSGAQPLAPPSPSSEAVSAPAKPNLAATEVQGTSAERQSVAKFGPMDPRIFWLIGAIVALLLLVAFSKRWFTKHHKASKQAQAAHHASTEDQMPLAFLYDLRKVTGRERYPLTSKLTLVGRTPPPQGPGEKVDCVLIERPNISRRHALIEYKHLNYWLTDQKSTNGTFVNGQRVTQEVLLKHGDKVRFDNIEFKFIWPGMEAAETTIITTRAGAESDHVSFSGRKIAEIDMSSPVVLPRVSNSTSADLKDAIFPQATSRKLASHSTPSPPANRPQPELKDKFFAPHPSASFTRPKEVNSEAKSSHPRERESLRDHDLSPKDSSEDLFGDEPTDFPAWDVVSAALGGDEVDLGPIPDPSLTPAADKKASSEQPGSESRAEDKTSDTDTPRPTSAEG